MIIDDNSKLVYLDWGVIVSLADGQRPDLLNSLQLARDNGSILIPFSATHVQEADNIFDKTGNNSLVESRLDYLSNITQNTYLYNAADVKEPRLMNEHPKSVRKTINDVSWAKPITHNMINMFGFEDMKRFRSELKLDPNDLNNIKPPGVINKLDALITEKVRELSGAETQHFGVRTLLDISLQYYPNSENLGLESHMAVVLTALNWLGFWPDKKNKTSLVAGHNDAGHAADAAFSHYFVSDDKSLRMRCMAAYDFFNINTTVLSSDEMVVILNK